MNNDEFYRILNQSSGVAAWSQTIGTLLAILGVWWQTNKQIAAAHNSRKEEEIKKINDTLIRSRFILNQCKSACKTVLELHDRFLEDQKLDAQFRSMKQAFFVQSSGESNFLRPNFKQYKELINATIINLLNIPYWDIVDAEHANNLYSIQNQARIAIFALEHEPSNSIALIGELIGLIENYENIIKA